MSGSFVALPDLLALRRIKMFGSFVDLPDLLTYEQAKAHHDSIKPIRGTDVRPIVNTRNGRRRKHAQIRQRHDGAIECILYATPVLTFHPNNEVHFYTGGWHSQSTRSFANEILRGHATFSGFKGDTQVSVAGVSCTLVQGKDVLRMRVETDSIPRGALAFIDPPKMYGYYLKRAPMGMRRKEIEPFTKYVMALAKMVNPEDYVKDRQPHTKWRNLNASQLYSLVTSDDAEKHATAAEWLLLAAYKRLWSAPPTINPKDIKAKLDDMLKYMFCEELFERRTVDTPSTNDNDKYLRGELTWL